MWLLLIALVGLVVPNGYFLYWLFLEFPGLEQVFQNHLAVAFILDAALATGLLCYHFAKHPIGRLRWPWFLLMSLVGGLGFSLPMYWWLNANPRFRTD